MCKWGNREMRKSHQFPDEYCRTTPVLQISIRSAPSYWLFLAFSLVYFLILTPCLAESPLQIVSANADSLILKFRLPPLQFNEREVEGRPFAEITFESAVLSMEIGRPRLPVYMQLIGIPGGASPYASILSSQSEIRQSKPIVPAQRPTLNHQQSAIDMDTSFYQRRNTFHPVKLVEVVPLGFIREQRVARLQIQPVQYNPVSGQLKIYNQLQVRIDFHLPRSAPVAPMAPAANQFNTSASQPFEQLFQKNLLNYDQAKVWRQYSSRLERSALAAPAAQSSPQKRYKIPITRTDLYEVTYNTLKRIGADAASIDPDTVTMENGGRRVGVYIFDRDDNGKFNLGDSIVFYGQALIGNKFTNENIYWLLWGSTSGSRVGEQDAVPESSDAPIPIAFKKTEHFEKDYLHDALVEVKSELADHYFWQGLTNQSQIRNLREKTFRIDVPRAMPRGDIQRDAQLRIRLQGAETKNNAEHRARIMFNKIQQGRVAEWRKQAAPIIVRDVKQREFIHRDTPNFLTIIAEDEPLSTRSRDFDFYLDWFELDYWHAFEASGGRLEFNSDTEPRVHGTVQYRVKNLRRSAVDVYKLIGGSIVSKLVNGQVNQIGTGHELTFEDNLTQPSSYFVVEKGRYPRPTRILSAQPFALRNPANQADYIIISHRDFIESVQPLVEFRQSQGLSLMVVDVETVYDQFSNGIFNPLAIQKFLRYAYTSWQKPAPTYVLLVGDAHFDYKNAIVKVYKLDGRSYDLYPIFVPTLHGWSPASGETAMDHRFVTISGDDTLPDMFIGRLSVQHPHELSDMIRKIVDYEDKPQAGPWQGRLMQIADNNVDHATDDIFERSREELIEKIIPVAYDTRKIYLGQIVSPEVTKRTILNTFNDGVLIAEYSGHGGTHTWADEGIFRIENAQQLQNQRLPFIVTTTCLNGQFDKPLPFGHRSLSEQFMMGRYGAVATLSATRLTFGSANAIFDKDLFSSMFEIKPPTLGAIIADAKTKFIMKSFELWIPGAEQYTLFGDPATRLAVPDLEISVELEEIALDPDKDIVILPNRVGRHQFSPVTGKIEFTTATDFDTGSMSALALFANDLDADATNDRPRRRDRIQVWQGEFGAIHIPIPQNTKPGQGIVRLFAFDNQRAAIGGTKFWMYQPIIHEVREVMDEKVTQTLSLSVQIVDNEGIAGIKSAEVIWSDTVDFKEQTTTMIPNPTPPESTVQGGVWYKLQAPIPLPKRGKTVRYQIVVTDSTNNVIRSERKMVKVPEGANVAIASMASRAAAIRYGFSKELKAFTLNADLVNNGGQPVDLDIEVWFSEGNPDLNNDHQIDADVKVFGHTIVRAEEWRPGAIDLQEVTATLILDEPLSTGFHKVYVFADPEDEDDDHADDIVGKLDESRSFDNKGFNSFVVNEFSLKANETLTAFSLDRIFDAFFPIDASEPTTLSIDTVEPLVSFQPDLTFVQLPIPSAVTSQSQGIQTGARAYKIELHSDTNQLVKPAEIKLRFDLNTLENHVQKKYNLAPDDDGFNRLLDREVDGLAIYAWQEKIKAWKRLPSEIPRDGNGDFTQERFVTPPALENASVQQLRASDIRVDPNLTPEGKWVVFFLDADRYEVLLRRNGKSEIEKLGQTGHLEKSFRDEILGIEFNIPRGKTDALGRSQIFEFGDILTFETQSLQGVIRFTSPRNANRGNGTAHVSVYGGKENRFEIGNWLLFFLNSKQFEIRNGFNELVRYQSGTPVRGVVNKPLILSDLGIELLVSSGNQPYEHGDKIKFGTAMVGIISAEVKELRTFALVLNSDRTAPKLQLWVNGAIPKSESEISPRPEISLFLEDENGVDMDSFIFAVSKDFKTFKKIKDFNITSEGPVTTLGIYYKPILYIGRYLFRIWVNDLNGNELGGKGGLREFLFFVEEDPDLKSPTIEIWVNGEVLTDGVVLREQPQFEVQISDEEKIDPGAVQLLFGEWGSLLLPLPEDSYDFEFDGNQPTFAQISFEPDLVNGNYQIQVLAADESENSAESPSYRFRLDEPVEISDVLNAPNPVRTNTAFTYNLVQPPNQVTIKIYTVNGRLVRTLEEDSPRRHYNETYWDVRDENGVRLANGAYFYKVIVETDDRKIEKIGRLAILR